MCVATVSVGRYYGCGFLHVCGLQLRRFTVDVAQANTWEEERKNSRYAEGLIQLPTEGRTVSPNPSKWVCSKEVLRTDWGLTGPRL